MRVIDADGHVEENLDTFSDKYLDPEFRSLRPRVTAVDGLVYWVIDEQLYPRRVGGSLVRTIVRCSRRAGPGYCCAFLLRFPAWRARDRRPAAKVVRAPALARPKLF